MCKSQNRKEMKLARPAVMLMLDELHNWLLFMDLKGQILLHETDRTVAPLKNCEKRFSIPQAFPQAG
jgi:hypothetical protein